jgi:phage-related protein
MAGQSRTLKLSILGDIDQLKKSLDTGSKEVQGFGSKLGDFSKKAGAAFAIAGAAAAAYAGKLLVDGVKAAVADQAAQEKLATTLRNVTGATNNQIKSVEDYITKTALAYGVTDDELRPSLERLARATNDVKKAQELQTLAIDIAAGSGKSLESVSNALAKAQEGNTTALGKLGVGLSNAQLKTLSMDEITKKLGDTFENQASVKAETFQGKMDRLKIAFDEGKETVGKFVLDAITPMVTFFVDKVIPTLSNVAGSIGKDLEGPLNAIKKMVTDFVLPAFVNLFKFFAEYVLPFLGNVFGPALDGLSGAWDKISDAVKTNEDDLQPLFTLFKTIATFVRDTLGPVIGTVLKTAFDVVGTAIGAVITAVSKLIGFFDNVIGKIKDFINLVKNNPLVSGLGNIIDNIFGGGRAAGGPVNAGTTYLVGERGPELFTPSGSGTIIPNNRLGGGGGGINITVNGALDPESVARQIITILNNSSYRGTLGAGALV